MDISIIDCYINKPKPREYVVPGLICGTVGSIVSPGGQGKSMFAVQLAHCIACKGLDLLGFGALTSGVVSYLSAEDNFSVLHERLYAIGQHLSDEQKESCAENLNFIDYSLSTPNLLEKKWVDEINLIAEGSRLLILDTLRSFHTGDENDGKAMSALIRVIRVIAAKTGCAIVFLHHANKSSALGGLADQQQASRGSSVLTDNIRWQTYLAGMTQEEAKQKNIPAEKRGFYVRYGISKQNYGSPFEEIWFKRKEGGILRPADFVADGTADRQEKRNKKGASDEL